MLGLDPLYVANEGKMMMAVAPGFEDADQGPGAMRSHPPPAVVLKSSVKS